MNKLLRAVSLLPLGVEWDVYQHPPDCFLLSFFNLSFFFLLLTSGLRFWFKAFCIGNLLMGAPAFRACQHWLQDHLSFGGHEPAALKILLLQQGAKVSLQEYITSWGCFAFQTSYNFFTHGHLLGPERGNLPLHHQLLFQKGSKEWLQMPLGVAGTSARCQEWWCPWHCLSVTSHLGSQQSPAWGEERKKWRRKKIPNLLPAEPSLQPMLRICLQNSGRTFQEGHSPSSIPALGKEAGTRRRCPSAWASASPSPALNFSREEQREFLSSASLSSPNSLLVHQSYTAIAQEKGNEGKTEENKP